MKPQELITLLNNCVAACNHCADSCLEESGMIQCIRTDRACAAVCKATAEVLTIKGIDAKMLIQTCKKMCEKCYEECSKHEHNHCKECAKACKDCAEACSEFC